MFEISCLVRDPPRMSGVITAAFSLSPTFTRLGGVVPSLTGLILLSWFVRREEEGPGGGGRTVKKRVRVEWCSGRGIVRKGSRCRRGSGKNPLKTTIPPSLTPLAV